MLALAGLLQPAALAQPVDPHHAHVVLSDAPRIATLHADGRRIVVPIQHVWRSMCFSHPHDLDHAELTRIARAAFESQSAVTNNDDAGETDGGFNVIFDTDASVPAAAQNALDRVEAFFEQQFSDPITVTVNISFEDLPGNALGAASSSYTNVSWNTARNALQQDMDASDIIQSHLPAGPRIPVRYNGESDHVTQESRVFWTLANFRAAVGNIAGDAGHMRFNDNIEWDYNPDNGVNGFSFVDTLIHEVGHILGFGSGADFLERDIVALDIFRFQRTDSGAGNDYNPDTYAEFQTTPRTVSSNLPDNDAVCDIIIAQYKMSDGFPHQASHFLDRQPPIGIMDPVLGQFETFAPGFFTGADRRMFDAIGWNR